jgi:hypothetical protein
VEDDALVKSPFRVRRRIGSAPLVEGEMLRVLLHVALLAALFVGAVLYAGNAIGAWEPPNIPVRAPDSKSEKTKQKKDKKDERSAKREKKR